MVPLDYAPAPRHDRFAALRVPTFRRYLTAATLVDVGTAGQAVAVGWEVYRRTDSPFLLGMIGLAQAVPMLLFTLPAGYLADSFDRRKILTCSMLGAAGVSVALGALSWAEGPVWALFALMFAEATCLRLGGPARAALVPSIVPLEALENATKWRTSLMQLGGVLGPAFGGVVVLYWLPGAYFLAAACTGAFAVFLRAIYPRHVKRGAAARARPLRQVGEGLAFVWRQKVLLGALSLDLFAVLLGGVVYLLPMFATDVIDLRGTGLSAEAALGWLRAAPAAGSLVMASLLLFLPPIRRAGTTMLLSVMLFGAATVGFGLSTNLWLSLALLALTGAFDNVSVVVRHTLVQLVTPDRMRGRVTAVNSVFIGSSNELGGFRSGATASWLGPVASTVAGGVGTLLVVAGCAVLFPRLRRFGALADARPDDEADLVDADAGATVGETVKPAPAA